MNGAHKQLKGRLATTQYLDHNFNHLHGQQSVQSIQCADRPAPLFRCNACFIKFTDEEALEDHILDLHSNPEQTTAEDGGEVEQPKNDPETMTNSSSTQETYGMKLISRVVDTRSNTPRNSGKQYPQLKFIAYKPESKLECANEGEEEKPSLQPIITPDKKFKCNMCEKIFTRKESLQYHFFCHTGEKPFRCVQCDLNFRAKSTLRTHIRAVHRGKATSNEKLLSKPTKQYPTTHKCFCPHCSETFKTLMRLNLHIRAKHSSLPYECLVCSEKFPTTTALEAHMRSHAKVETKEPPKQHISFAKDAPENKVISENSPVLYPCDLCPKSFSKKVNLHSHMLTHKERTVRFRCSVCNETFTTKSAVQDHMRAHSGKFHKCHFCTHSFSTKLKLSQHISHVHKVQISQNDTQRKLTQSSVRAALFSAKSAAKKREFDRSKKARRRARKSNKPYNQGLAVRKCHECPQCGKKFTMQKNLMTHISYTHREGKNRYQCPHCEKSFYYECRLNNHISAIHV